MNVRIGVIIGLLFAICGTLVSINKRLLDIQQRLAVANCLTEMKLGQECPELMK